MQDVPYVCTEEDAVVDVGLPKLEVRIVFEGAQVLARSRYEVVEREHAHASREQGLAEVRADEAGAARHDGSWFAAVGLTRGRCLDR